MERILVTGAGGFVGSYLAENLQCHGYGVTGLVRGNFAPAKKTYPVVSADLAEAVDVEWNGDIIVHAAGRVPSAGVSASEYKRDNIDAMERLLKIAARKKVRLIIYLSTMDVYGRKNTEKILDENTEKILDENTEYGISKYYAERLLQENGHVNYVILRVPGVFGRGMSNTWLARAINNMAQDNAVEVYSAGFANNNFIAIEDLAKFIRTIISRSIYNDVFVLGNEEKIRIIDMMNILKEEMRSKSEIVVRENRIIPFSINVSHALANGFSSLNFQTMVKNFFPKGHPINVYVFICIVMILEIGGVVMEIRDVAMKMRQDIFRMAVRANGGHIAPAYSMTDIVAVLFFDNVLRYNPREPEWIDRDYFILSKGHGALALYSALSLAGYFDRRELDSFCMPGSELGSLARMGHVPGVEATTGSLGHGLSFAAGIALACKMDKKDNHVYALLGDGECQEGSVWEAVMAAAHHRLDNMTVIIDYNKLQAMDSIDNIMSIKGFSERFAAFGFKAIDIDGHNLSEIKDALMMREENKPVAVIAHTIKGKGLSFMENVPIWHYRIPNEDEMETALKELNLTREELGSYEKCVFRNII